MAGIPVHTASPINANAAKAAGVTPATTQPNNTANRSVPTCTPAPTTAVSPGYPPARPKAAPGPAPTGAPQSSNLYPTETLPPAPTQPSNAPPAPQPGATPSPFVTQASSITRARQPSIPPPKTGEIPTPAAHYAPHYEQEQQVQQSPYSSRTKPPPQMTAMLSTPIHAVPPSSATSPPAYADLSHPPGYVQNSRECFDERSDVHSPYGNNSSAHRGGLLDSGRYTHQAEESPIAQVWKTATSWAKTAGEKLKEGEEEVWRRINEK